MLNLRPKTVRVRNGVREVLYGGYVHFKGRKKYPDHYQGYMGYEKEIRAWGKVVDESDCGPGTDYVVKLIAAKAKKTPADVRETWRY